MKTFATLILLVGSAFGQAILGPILTGQGTSGGGGGGGGSVALVAHSVGHAVDNAVTGAIDTTGANFIVCLLSDYSGGPVDNFVDSKSNSWTALTSQTATAGANRETIYYVVSPTVGTGHTFTNNTTGSYSMIACAAFSGVKTTSTLVAQNGTSITYGGIGSMQYGSVTPATTGDLAIAVTTWSFGSSQNVTFSIDSGFTISDCYTANTGVTEGGCLAYLITTGTSALNPGWTNGGISSPAAGTNAVFAKQ